MRQGRVQSPRTLVESPRSGSACFWVLCACLLVFMSSCKQGLRPHYDHVDSDDPLDTAGEPADTGDQEEVPREGWFDAAVLDPPFQHGNAIWAGVAILDFDGDGLQDLFFTNGGNHPDALYRNLGGGRFEDVAAEAGVNSLERHGAVSSGDLDNDGDPDLVVLTECTSGTLDEDGGRAIGDGAVTLYINEGDGTFTERVPVAMNRFQHTMGRCPVSVDLGDINRDGFLDLSISNGLDPDQAFPWIFLKLVDEAADMIWLNDGTGDFVEELDADWRPGELPGGLKFVTFTSVLMDINGDGLLDRIAGQGGGPLETFLQVDWVGFERSDHFSDVPDGLWMGVAVADFDRDADLDFYATNQGLSPLMQGYDNIPDVASGETLSGNATVDPHLNGLISPFHEMISIENGVLVTRDDWGLEADHQLAGDLFDGFPDPVDGVPRYPDWINPEGLQRLPWAWGVVPLDVNADGYSDVAFTGNNCAAPMGIIWNEQEGAGPGGLLLNLEGQGFRDVIWEANIPNTDRYGRYQDGRGIATGDLNGDGYADLVYVNRTYNPSQSDPLAQEPGEPHVWLSRPREGGWLQVQLLGSASNREGLGSQIVVDDGTQPVAYGMGYGGNTNSSSQRSFLVGLGDAESVDLQIRFPSGTLVELDDVDANQLIVVEEP